MDTFCRSTNEKCVICKYGLHRIGIYLLWDQFEYGDVGDCFDESEYMLMIMLQSLMKGWMVFLMIMIFVIDNIEWRATKRTRAKKLGKQQ